MILRIALLLKELCIMVQHFVIWNYIKSDYWEIKRLYVDIWHAYKQKKLAKYNDFRCLNLQFKNTNQNK